MLRRCALVALAAGCHAHHPAGPVPPALEAQVVTLAWSHAPARCAQGPFELALDAGDDRWGEDFELDVHAPHGIALESEILVDGNVVAKASGTYGGALDNTRCVASVTERLAARAPGGGDSATAPAAGAHATAAPVEAAPAAPIALVPDASAPSASAAVIHVHVDRPAHQRVVLRFWSVEPNDLDGVELGASHVAWRPNVPEAEYVAYLQRQAAQAAEAERAREAAEARRLAALPSAPPPDPAKLAAEQRAREAAEAEERRRREVAAALEAERARRRHIYCDAHHEDTACWGAGGYRVHAELDARDRERAAYCAEHENDARCWSAAERTRRESAWQLRGYAALTAATKRPEGPPPAPREETAPPKLSLHAEWRPGYWQWLGGSWVWLAGQWRVPPEDIAAETTTTAPAAPPPPRDDAPPAAPPAVGTVWIPGFWQWGGTTWIWVPGSWQLRPSGHVAWRAAVWRQRGAVHVLVPGGWEPAR